MKTTNAIEPLTVALLESKHKSLSEKIEDFRRAMHESGLIPPSAVIADGKFHRFSTNGNPNDDAGWYVFNEYPIAVGSFGCWRSGLTDSWSAVEERSMSQEDRTKYKQAIQQMNKVNDEEKAKANHAASLNAQKLWDQANEAPSTHPYLVAKKADAFGIKALDKKLIIPLRDEEGKLWNIQQVSENGEKRFLKNGKVKGLFHIIGQPADLIYIGEGYATMASVHSATGKACFVAFNAGNLKDVCSQVRASYPDNEIVVCADDDYLTKGNPGLTKAKEAALGISAGLAVPDFGETRGNRETDFNDLHRSMGLEKVKTAVDINRLSPEELVNETDLAVLANLAGNWVAEPEPVLPILSPQTEFPIESLPLLIREAVRETLDYTQAPIGLACSTALGVASTCVQHLALVARDHQTVGPVSLFVLSVLRSGERKSTIFRKMWKGIWEMQRELKEQWDHYQEEKQGKLTHLFERDIPPKILFEDATVQGLAKEIETGVRSVLMSSSEGGTVFGGIGMRGDALMGALAFLNKAWDAEPQSMTRKQAESNYLEFYRLSCLISSQRETIQDWLSKNAGLAEGMGFLARFLVCIPESTIGFRLYKQAPEFTPKLDKFNDQCLKKLRKKTYLAKPQILPLSDDAHRIWVEYFNLVEEAQGRGGPYEYNTAAASKSAEQAARIAAVFTLFNEEEVLEVGLEAMKQGISIAKWFLDESLRLTSHLTTTNAQRHGLILLEWLKKLEIDNEAPLKVGDLLKFGPRPIRKKTDRDDAVKMLAELGWIQVRKWRNSKIILLHPSIKKL
jgi:putative DNA primase/helicase